MGGRRAWTGWRAPALALALALATPAARAAEPPPPAAPQVEGLLRAGIEVLRGAVAGQPAAEQPAAADANAAAEKQRQQQIDRQAQQMRQFFQPLLQAELELVRKTCPGLAPAARRKIVAAGDEVVKETARQFARRQFGQEHGKAFDPRQTIRAAIAAAVGAHAAADEFAAYQREQVRRTARREQAARTQIVAKLDRQLGLSAEQRAAIERDLEKLWDPAWVRELDDHGGIRINNASPAPDFADKCIAPHLAERQRAAWKEWSQQAGWSRMGAHVNAGWNFDGISLQPDPWWAP